MNFKTMVSSFIVGIIIVFPALGEGSHKIENIGTAEFALMSPIWPCKEAREAEQSLLTLRKAVLWNTFGTSNECLLQYLQDSRLRVLELHLINEPCQRNRRCGPYEFLYGMSVAEYDRKLRTKDPELLSSLKKYLQTPSDILKKHLSPSTRCYISPGLESNLSLEGAKVLMSEVAPFFPQCQLVWNPVNGSKYAEPLAGTIFEQHGISPSVNAPCIVDLDGADMNFSSRPALLPQRLQESLLPQYLNSYSKCVANFLWIAEYNGLTAGGKFIDPRERTHFPSSATFSLLASVLLAAQRGSH